MVLKAGNVAVAGLLGLGCVVLQAQFSLPGGVKLPTGTGTSAGSGQSGNPGAGLSDSQIGSGIKDALSVGTKRAVESVAKPGG